MNFQSPSHLLPKPCVQRERERGANRPLSVLNLVSPLKLGAFYQHNLHWHKNVIDQIKEATKKNSTNRDPTKYSVVVVAYFKQRSGFIPLSKKTEYSTWYIWRRSWQRTSPFEKFREKKSMKLARSCRRISIHFLVTVGWYPSHDCFFFYDPTPNGSMIH